MRLVKGILKCDVCDRECKVAIRFEIQATIPRTEAYICTGCVKQMNNLSKKGIEL